MYCKCVEELFEAHSKQMAMGIDPDGLEILGSPAPHLLGAREGGQAPRRKSFLGGEISGSPS